MQVRSLIELDLADELGQQLALRAMKKDRRRDYLAR